MKKNLKIVLFTVAMIAIVGFSIKLIGAQYQCASLGTQFYEHYDEENMGDCMCGGVAQIGDKINCNYNMVGGGSDCREINCGKVTCCLDEEPTN